MLSFAMARLGKELQIERQLVVVPSCCDHKCLATVDLTAFQEKDSENADSHF